MKPSEGIKTAAMVLALAAIYFGASKFGLTLTFTAKQVTAVWPPTGIALAAILLFGYRLWPGIALGAFLANVTAQEPIAVACGIALGNTLEAVIGAWVLHRFANFDVALGRLKDVRSLLVYAALFSTMISATIGVTSLCLGGVHSWQTYRFLWLLWWLGDATGAVLVAPLLLVWGSRRYNFRHIVRVIEALALITGLSAVCMSIFMSISVMGLNGRDFVYCIFPFIIWAAIRFGQHGTTFTTLVASSLALWGTLHNTGPFITGVSSDQDFMVLQVFMAVVATTGLFLGAAIAERKQAERALKEADRNKSEFLTMLAHELRNPLASISSALYITQLPKASAEQRATASAIMERQLQQTVRLIEDLVDVSRISHGKIELRKEPIALAEAVNIATEATRPLMDMNHHTFFVDMPEEPVWLNADLTRLSQILTNLLNNAAKYTPARGLIQLGAKTEKEGVVIHIRDTGVGIPSTMLPKVFDMFMQAGNSPERSSGGLGVGLTLVKRLVELHGGCVEAHSPGAGRGSEFIVRLPTIPPPQAALPAERATKPPQAPRKFRILLADDNEPFVETFSQMLALLGHDVRVAYDGLQALVLAESFLPEVILLDIGLPKLDGCGVCQKIRAMPALERSVLIAQTGYSQPEHRERSRAAGFDHHLVKPIRFEVMEELLLSLNPTVPVNISTAA